MQTLHFSRHFDSSTITGTSTLWVAKAIKFLGSRGAGGQGSREWGGVEVFVPLITGGVIFSEQQHRRLLSLDPLPPRMARLGV